jgi:ectoine hydroxylase-related dioxygenase (phytanoyl-CoA dioxygenase family)
MARFVTRNGDRLGLTEQQLARYDADGYLRIEGLLGAPEIARARAEATRLLAEKERLTPKNLRCRWQSHVDTGAPLLEALDPVIDLSPELEAIARAPALMDRVSEIFGETACLFKDKLIYKPPGAIGHALHQDFIAWPGFPRTFTTVLIALDEANDENGCLEVFAGYHRQGSFAPNDGDYHDLPAASFDPGRRQRLFLRPGDAAIFGAFLPHGSGANRSRGSRRHLYLSYNALSDGGDQRARHYQDFHRWLLARYGEYGSRDFFFR